MNDDVIEPTADRSHAPGPAPRAESPVPAAPATDGAKRAFGRALDDFRDQPTPSGLLPAEEKLLAAAAKGELCRLEGMAIRQWSAFQAWAGRPGAQEKAKRLQDSLLDGTVSAADLEADQDVSTLMEDMPADVLALMEASASAARAKLGKPEDWNPETAEDLQAFAPHQQAFLKHYGEHIVPQGAVNAARNNPEFFALCVAAMRATGQRSDDLQARIAALPPVLQPFVDELPRFLSRDAAERDELVAQVAKEPEALRPAINACFDMFQRETWRWVDHEDKDLHVRAGLVRFLLLGGDAATPVHERGVTVVGARIIGALDGFGVSADRPVQFVGCVFDAPVDLTDAKTGFLNFQSCFMPGLTAARSNISGGLYLRLGCRSNGTFVLDGARIGGDLDLSTSTIEVTSGSALNANGVTVSGSLNLSDGFTATGDVRLFGARIGGQLNCTRGAFLNANGTALVADRAEIGSNARLADGFRAEGKVQLILARIGAQFICSNARFLTSGGDALVFNRATVRGDVFLDSGFLGDGRVSIEGATIGGDLVVSGGRIQNANGVALNANAIHVSGDAYLAQGFQADGEVSFVGARIDGSLQCAGGRFSAPTGTAMRADGLTVRNSIHFIGSFRADGQVRLSGAKVRGDVICANGTIHNPLADAFSLDNVEVSGDVFLWSGFVVEGTVRLPGAKISGVLFCSGGRFVAPKRNAIYMDGADIKGNVTLAIDFRAEGTVQLTGARIGGELQCGGGQFIAPAANALVADGIQVTGGVGLGHGFRAEGAVVLFGARIGNQLTCTNGTIVAPGQVALNADRVDVTTNVRLDGGFRAEGDVHLILAKIGGQLVCTQGTFVSPLGMALIANGAHVTGEVFLSDEFRAEGPVSLTGATLGNDLICRNGTFISASAPALDADGAVVAGNVHLNHGFRAEGEVHFSNAKIRGDLRCVQGAMLAPEGTAFHGSNIDVTGNVFFTNGFRSDGEILLSGAKIGGELLLVGGAFFNLRPRPASANEAATYSRDAVNLNKASLQGRLWLGSGSGDGDRPVDIRGSIYLGGTHASELVLDPAALAVARMQSTDLGATDAPLTTVALDGFTCNHLHVSSHGTARSPEPLDAMRALLERQPANHLAEDFRPQPYEHAIALFKRMGRPEDAKALAKDKARGERRRTIALAQAKSRDALASTLSKLVSGFALAAWLILLWGLLAHPVKYQPLAEFVETAGPVAWLLVLAGFATPPFRLLGRLMAVGARWLVMDWFLGQGYDYKWPMATVLGLLFGGMALYGSAAGQGVFVPVDKGFVADPDHRRLCAGLPPDVAAPPKDVALDWTRCQRKIDGLTPFHPVVYSLDLMIPFSPLGQRRDWKVDAERPLRIEVPGLTTWQTTGKSVVTAATLQATLAIALYALLAAFLAGRIKKE